MNAFEARALIWNPSDASRSTAVELIVDTGSTYTVLPESLLSSLGIKLVRIVRLCPADNRTIERPLGEISIEIESYRASATPAIF